MFYIWPYRLLFTIKGAYNYVDEEISIRAKGVSQSPIKHNADYIFFCLHLNWVGVSSLFVILRD